MGYSPDIYNAAVAAIAARHNRAVAVAQERRDAFVAKCPEYEQLERQLSRTGARLAAEIFRGGRDGVAAIREENLTVQRRMAELLAQYGLTEKYLEPDFSCRTCSDTGMVDGKPCTCLLHELRRISYDRLNRSAPLSVSSFDTFRLDHYPEQAESDRALSPRRVMERTFERCKAYARNFDMSSPSLLFQGGVGLGKTHLSLAIAGEVIEQGYDVVYGSAFSLFSKIEKEKFSRNADDDDTLSLLNSCDLLILDDLGTEFITQFTMSVLYNIVNSRILSGRPTIISTNLTIENLQEKYTERLVSRIYGSFQRFPFVGKDMRISMRKARAAE